MAITGYSSENCLWTSCVDVSLHANVQMSGWWEVRYQTKDDWKSITPVFGEQSVTTCSTTLMLASSVIFLDTGWYWFGISLMISYLKINM